MPCYFARNSGATMRDKRAGVTLPSIWCQACWVYSQALIRRRSTEPNLKHCKRNEKQSWDLLLNWCLKNSNWLIDWNWKLHTKCNWKCCNCENWWNLLCQWKQDITNTQNNKNEIFAIIIRTVYFRYVSIFMIISWKYTILIIITVEVEAMLWLS